MARKRQDEGVVRVMTIEDVRAIDWGTPDKYDFSGTPEMARRAVVGSYVENHYEHYRHDHAINYGRQISQNNYATNLIGIDNVAFSLIKNGHKLPSVEQADVLAAFYGPIIWDLCGYSRRMPKDKMLYDMADLWPKLSDRAQAELFERARNLYDNGDIKHDEKGLDTNEESTKI